MGLLVSWLSSHKKTNESYLNIDYTYYIEDSWWYLAYTI